MSVQRTIASTRVLDHLKLMGEVGIAPHELLFAYNWTAKAARRIFGFANSKTTVAVVAAQNRDPLPPEFCVDVACQCVYP